MATPPEAEGPGDAPEEGVNAGEISVRRIEVLHLVLVLLLSGLGLASDRSLGLGVLLGGGLMALNFRIIVGVMRSVFLRGSTRLANVGVYWLKFAGVLFLVSLLIAFFEIDPIGLLVGLSVILVAITCEAAVHLRRRPFPD